MYCDQCGKRFPGPGVIIPVVLGRRITVCDPCATSRLERITEKVKRNDHFQMIRLFDGSIPIGDNTPLSMGVCALNYGEQLELMLGYEREVEGLRLDRDFMIL